MASHHGEQRTPAWYLRRAHPQANAGCRRTVGEWIHENRTSCCRLLNTTYKERYRVFELPPNPGGLATLEILNVLEELDVGSMGLNTADYLHASIEAKKLAWGERNRLQAAPLSGCVAHADASLHSSGSRGILRGSGQAQCAGG